MSRKSEQYSIVTSWTNGRKAVVHLLQTPTGESVISKVYRPGFTFEMVREFFAAAYVAKRLSIVPKIIAFRPFRRELVLSYVRGQRILEWVLQRFGDGNVVLSDFQSFHGLETHPAVTTAFQRFRESQSEEACRLKQSIRASYRSLHKIGMVHGSTDPRNVIYDGSQVFIIDFDHARPSLNPGKLDGPPLSRWYGLP